MHRHCIILISLLVLLAAPLAAQPAVINTTTGWKPDTVSVEEMKQNFYDWLYGIPARPEPTSERFLTDASCFRSSRATPTPDGTSSTWTARDYRSWPRP